MRWTLLLIAVLVAGCATPTGPEIAAGMVQMMKYYRAECIKAGLPDGPLADRCAQNIIEHDRAMSAAILQGAMTPR